MLGEKYMQVLLLLLVHCVTLILIFFKTSGLLFRVELGLFIFMLLISIIYLFGLFFDEGWAWVLIMLFFGVNILNLIFLKTKISGAWILFGIVLIVDIVGFFKAIANIGEEEEDLEVEPYESEQKKERQEAPEVTVYHHDDEPAKVEKVVVKEARPKARRKASKAEKPLVKIKDLKDRKKDKKRSEYII